MENKQMADYTLTIKADSGYESTTEGRCTAEQYGQAIAALHGEASQRTWVGLTDEQIDAAIRNSKKVDTGYAGWVRDQRREFARAIEAAHGIKE